MATYTAASREEVQDQYENFLSKHPEGKITKKDFRNIMQVSWFFSVKVKYIF